MTISSTNSTNNIFKSTRKLLNIADNVTLSDFILNSRKKSADLNYPCFTDAITKESITYTELYDTIPKLASGLHNNFGINNGDIVTLFSPNHINSGACVLGIIDLGAAYSAVNYTYTSSELSELLKLVKPKVLFIVPETLEVSQKAIKDPELSNIKLAFLSNEGNSQYPNIPNFKQILSSKPYPKLKFTNSTQSKEQVAAILFSSGTTGMPKGVMLSHYGLLTNMHQSLNIYGGYYQPRNTFINILPFYHCYALMSDMFQPIHCGCTTNIIKKFDLKLYLETLDKNEVQICFVVPPIIVAIAKHPMVKNYKVSNIKNFVCGAAPLSKELEDEVFSKYGIKCAQVYGGTELGPLSHALDIEDNRAGSAGLMVSNMECIVVDADTEERLGPNKRGELRLKGPSIMMGYYKDEKANMNTFDKDGFIKTGDIVYIDSDGYIFIVDRLKELIKVKGLQVAPAELEAALLTHPEVADACVIGVPDNAAGELPKGFITLKNPNATNKAEIIKSIHSYIGEKLAHYKQLKGGLEIISEIPKSPSGKILRRKLRELQYNNKPKL